jgi:Cu/Ag efflux protein CusF
MKKLLTALAAATAIIGSIGIGLAQSEASAKGEVRRLDLNKGTITLKHGAISDLNLPAMTLVYDIDPSLLHEVEPGDEVRFKVRYQNDKYEIIELKR